MGITLPDLHLKALGNGMPALTPARGTTMAESAAVCFEDRSHTSGVSIAVVGLADKTFSIAWDEVTDRHRSTYGDLQDATEDGACGIAILLVMTLTGKKAIHRSKKGPGFDYWVGESDDDELIFSNKARLEISGILNGDDKIIDGRFKTKTNQVKPSDSSGFPAYIAIIEFGQPKARVELKK